MKSTINKIFIGSINVFSKIFYNYFILKIVSIYMGPLGIGIYSQFRSFYQFAYTLTNLNSSAIVIQRLSNNRNKLEFFITSFSLIFFINLIFFFIIYFNINYFAELIFSSNNYKFVQILKYSIYIIPLTSIIILLMSSLNGLKLFKFYTLSSLLTALIYVLVSIFYLKEIQSQNFIFVLKIILLSEIITLLVILLFLINFLYTNLKNLNLLENFFSSLFIFFKNSSVFLISGLMLYFNILLIKIFINKTSGFTELGVFESAWSIALLSTFIIVRSIVIYYLPELSSCKKEDIKKIINKYISISPFIIIIILCPLMFLNKQLITLLFSLEFIEAFRYLRWLILAEIFKLYMSLFTYPLIAKNYLKQFLILEVIYNSAFLIISYICIFIFNNIELFCIGYTLINLFILIIFYLFCKVKFEYRFLLIDKLSLFTSLIFVIILFVLNFEQQYNLYLNLLILIIFSLIIIYFNRNKIHLLN